MKYLLALLLIGSCVASYAASLPQDEPVPGGVALVPLERGGAAPHAYFNRERVMVLKNGARWLAVVGIPLDAKPGGYAVRVQDRSFGFSVRDKQYAVQRITIKDERKVEPTAQDLRRIQRESAIIHAALAAWRDKQNVALQFDLPVLGPVSSPFGLRRVFNGEPRNPHSGLDIAVPAGTRIHAAAPGRVAAIGDFFFDGNMVMIDHGQGLVTMYAHMEKVLVKKGQRVARGEVIGLVGQTGRATGPHVHWGVSLNNARVDPTLFLSPDELARLEGK
ncbi:MAG: peptidoglycan DD-metalloendopeptidase family protein [Burkholderiales bacterium]